MKSGKCQEGRRLEELHKFFLGQANLAQNSSQKAALYVLAAVKWNRGGAFGNLINKNDMASASVLLEEALLPKDLDDFRCR